MTFYEAAIIVMKGAGYPLTAREITNEALDRGLITSKGKTPDVTMAAVLYGRLGSDPDLVKLEEKGKNRARRGSVRWTVRRT